MKYGLTLEGGGARGAYHIGAVKALVENGYEFDAVVGTSIGAINAAFIAQGDVDVAYDMWHTLSFKDLFNVEEEKIQNAMNINLDINTVKYLSSKLKKVIKEKGIDTLKIREILEEKVDEEKIRNSDIKLGLVTFCLSDKSGEELYIDDIKNGDLINYLMASSNLPVFQRVKLNDKKYMDGGVYDNCPVNLLEKKGIKEAVVIRTYKRMRIRGYKDIVKRGNVNMHMIQPVDELTSILNFDSNNLNELLKLGYFDALKMVKSLDGIRYYLDPVPEEKMLEKLRDVDYDKIQKIASLGSIKLDIGEYANDLLIYKIVPSLAQKTKNKDLSGIKDYVFALLEYVALENNVEKYKIYTIDEFIKAIQSTPKKTGNKAIKEFVNSLK